MDKEKELSNTMVIFVGLFCILMMITLILAIFGQDFAFVTFVLAFICVIIANGFAEAVQRCENFKGNNPK